MTCRVQADSEYNFWVSSDPSKTKWERTNKCRQQHNSHQLWTAVNIFVELELESFSRYDEVWSKPQTYVCNFWDKMLSCKWTSFLCSIEEAFNILAWSKIFLFRDLLPTTISSQQNASRNVRRLIRRLEDPSHLKLVCNAKDWHWYWGQA